MASLGVKVRVAVVLALCVLLSVRGDGQTTLQRLSRSTNISIGPPEITTGLTLPSATVGSAYSQAITCAGGDGSLVLTATDQQGASSALPSGLSLSMGTVTGTPDVGTSGVHQFWVTCTDSGSPTESDSVLFTLTIILVNPTISTNSPLTACVEDLSCSRTVNATGGSGTYTWSLNSGSAPTGMTFADSGNNGVLSGTPTTPGSYQFVARVVDSLGGAQNKLFDVEITATPNGPVVITTASLISGTDEVLYSQQVCADEGSGTFAWAVTVGSLPTGLSLAASGTPCTTISGTPTTPNTYNFTVEVDDGTSTDTQALAIIINPAAVPGVHPTVGVTSSEVSTFRTYTHANNSAALQAIFTALDTVVTAGCQNTNTCGGTAALVPGTAQAMAFVGGVLTPEWAEGLGYTVSNDFDTAAEACAIAYSLLNTTVTGGTTIWAKVQAVTNEATSRAAKEELHGLTSSGPELWYVTVPLVYDWCYNALTAPQKSNLEGLMDTWILKGFRLRDTATKSISSLTQVAGLATAVAASHGYTTGMTIQILGSNQGSQYNGYRTITVTDANTFTFAVGAGSTTPATGTITARGEGLREYPADFGGEAFSNYIVGNRGVYESRFLGLIAMGGLLGQGAVSAPAEALITEAINRVFANQVRHELEELFLRDGKAGFAEAGVGIYAGDALTGISVASMLGRTIPGMASTLTTIGTFLNQIPDYYVRSVIPYTWKQSPTWSWSIASERSNEVDNAEQRYVIPLVVGGCRALGLVCAGKMRWFMEQMFSGSYPTALDGTNELIYRGIYMRLLGGWGGVTSTAIINASVSARTGMESFSWGDFTDTNSSWVTMQMSEMSNGGHSQFSGDNGQLGIWKHGAFILNYMFSSKGGYGQDMPWGFYLGSSTLRYYRTDLNTLDSRIFLEASDVQGTQAQAWESRDTDFDYKQEGTLYASNPDHPTVGYVASDHSDDHGGPITAGNGAMKGYIQHEFVYLKGLDFAWQFDRSTLATPTTVKRVKRFTTPVQPVFNGTTSNPRFGRWTSSNSAYVEVVNDSGTGDWTATDGQGNTNGPWPETHVRGFILPVGTYETWATVGHDSAFSTTGAALWPTDPQRNLENQRAGATDRITNGIADKIGINAAHNNNGADGCTYTLTDLGSYVPTTTLANRMSLAGHFEHRTVTSYPSATTVTVSATGGCPAVASGSQVSYALQNNTSRWGWSADDHRLLGWGQFRLELPSSTNATEYFSVGLQWGDSDTFTTPTTITEINDSDQRGGQAHGGGVEAVVVFAETAPNPWTTSPADPIPTSTWPLGGSTTTWDFTCYTGVAIRQVAVNFQPDTDYQVAVSNLGGQSCRVTVTRNGGSVTIGSDGMLTFISTDTTVS